MRRIRSKDCRLLAAPPPAVYTVLADLPNYARWWPPEIGFTPLPAPPGAPGPRLQVRVMGSGFCVEVERVVEFAEVHIRYFAGAHQGTGVWTLTPMEGGTNLCYAIDLEPQTWAGRILSHVMDFSSLHSRLMQKIFDGLQRHLAAGSAPPPGRGRG